MRVSFIAEFVDSGVGGINAQVYRLFHALKAKGIEISLNDGRKQADVVHLHTPFVRAWKAVNSHIPSLATIHSLPDGPAHYLPPPVRPLFSILGWKYYRLFYRNIGKRIVPTPFVKEEMQRHGIPVEEVLSNGVDLRIFRKNKKYERSFRDAYDIEGPYILSVSDIRPAKNVHLIPHIARQLSQTQFIHSGISNSLAPSSYKRHIFSQDPQNLRFLGRLSPEHLVGAYSGATALLHPSQAETEGLVLLEALACKTPVIVNDIPLYKGFLSHNHDALVSLTAQDFIRNTGRISQNKQLRAKLSRNGYLVAKQRDFRKTVEKHIQFYEELAR